MGSGSGILGCPSRCRPAPSGKEDTMKTATLTKAKETKGTWQYREDAQLPVIGTLYVPKYTLEQLGWPETIKVTVESA